MRNAEGQPDPSPVTGGHLVVDAGGGGAAAHVLQQPEGGLTVHLALPAVGTGPWPGVVLVPGPSAVGRAWKRQLDQARRLADQGFVVVLPEPAPGPARPAVGLLGRLGGRQRADRTHRSGRWERSEGERFDRVEAARAWLAAQSACTGAVSVVGLR